MNVLDFLLRRRSLAATIDLASREVARDPHPWYERLRRGGPVQFLRRENAWIVLGYDEVQAAFGLPDVLSNAPYRTVDDVLLGSDPPEHTHPRRVITRLFSGATIEALAEYAEARAVALLRPRFDVVTEYANVLSADVAAELIRLDAPARARLRLAAGDVQNRDATAYFTAIDTIAPEAGVYEDLRREGFDIRQATSLVRLLWLAATTTTERVIAYSVYRLLLHPEHRELEHVTPFVQEVLRLHPGELLVPRWTTAPVPLAGREIPAGALVHLCIAAANRDPAKFERPSEFLLHRPPVRILTFGAGIHHCVGLALGRRVIEASIRALLTHAPNFSAAQPLRDLVGWCARSANPIARLVIEAGA